MKKALLIVFALLMIPCISFAEDFIINFESDALGKAYPCVAGNKSDISAVVEKCPWGSYVVQQSLHIVTANRGACPKFTVTLPKGKTLADVKAISFHFFVEKINGTNDPDVKYVYKNFYCMFGEKGSSSLASSNLDAYITSQFDIPIYGRSSGRFVPTIPDNLLSLNQFDWAFGLEASPCDYYLDNITFTFFKGEFDIDGVVNVPWHENLYYQGHDLIYTPQTYVKEGAIINPYQVTVVIDRIPEPTDITYSLYTYKPTFKQADGRRYDPPYVTSPSIGAMNYGPGMTFSTQKDIDDNLDLIYTFPPIKETETGYRYIDWDGKTSDGQAVRDCVLLAAHDSTGKFLGIGYGIGIQGYRINSRPGVEYTAHNTKEDGKYVSAKIILAYEKPVRRIWAIVGTAACTMGSKRMSFKVVNEGAEAIAATMNSEAIKPALAVTELKNPTLDEGGLVKIYKWDNIRKINWNEPKWKNYITTYNTGTWQPAPELDGTSLLPPDEETDYEMIIVIEGDDGNGNVIPTFTGLNDGYVFEGWPVHFPMPQLETDIPVIPVVSPVYNMEGGIGIHASNEKVSIYGIDGRLVKQVVAEPFIPLPQGLYIVKVGTAEAVKVVVK